MKLLLFNKNLVEYMKMCNRYKMRFMTNIIINGNKNRLLPFDEVRIIPVRNNVIIYFMYENNKIFEIKLSDVMNCEYVEFGLFFNIYLK